MIGAHGIVDASTRTVQDAATLLPQMGGTLLGWFRPLDLVMVTKKTVNFELVESEEPLTCQGVIQPFSARELKIKPEGERSWAWQMLHTTIDVNLPNDSIFVFKGLKYRVMSELPYSDYGYRQYELVQGYQDKP